MYAKTFLPRRKSTKSLDTVEVTELTQEQDMGRKSRRCELSKGTYLANRLSNRCTHPLPHGYRAELDSLTLLHAAMKKQIVFGGLNKARKALRASASQNAPQNAPRMHCARDRDVYAFIWRYDHVHQFILTSWP
ncbi:unnamed protein product [Nesidiocoris tenuis]|uniref:Uncharacterized protein n=1 Tax=Nesidiocoris tenuis TaxID=355587 RepID=A0A6H5G8D9_9HEMI|nr:unnamed protein product [Nesidiocoris tenuis]